MEYLDILKQALVYVLTAYWCYQMVISLCALVKLKDKPLITNKKSCKTKCFTGFIIFQLCTIAAVVP